MVSASIPSPPEVCAAALQNTPFHDPPVQTVRARLHTRERCFESQFYPGDLQILDRSVQQHAGQRVYAHVLLARPSGPRPTMTVEPRLLMYESERHEFRESTGAFFNRAQEEHVPHPIRRLFDVTVHHR